MDSKEKALDLQKKYIEKLKKMCLYTEQINTDAIELAIEEVKAIIGIFPIPLKVNGKEMGVNIDKRPDWEKVKTELEILLEENRK